MNRVVSIEKHCLTLPIPLNKSHTASPRLYITYKKRTDTSKQCFLQGWSCPKTKHLCPNSTHTKDTPKTVVRILNPTRIGFHSYPFGVSLWIVFESWSMDWMIG
ncbi:MAG TPA: hypothetical protein DCE42_09885 [Myxococcales bacterium]|nr:hypothetical protein [Deltaproteobacteria bacterium]MBU50688.1 hypothetical protein [Deltaproteobacteria bacterium]HAA55058.1 hypothetical protein [Myxococcales bacterium]